MLINEIFYSIQGEGFLTGCPAVFVRVAACNVGCDYCDTDFSFVIDLNWLQVASEVSSLLEICEKVHGPDPRRKPWVVLTGGEPLTQGEELYYLASELRNHMFIQLETNGTIPCQVGMFDHVTVSPKRGFNPEHVRGANELKIIYPQQWEGIGVLENWMDIIQSVHTDGRFYVYIQPCDEGNNETSRENLRGALELVKKYPWLRLSVQVHKYVGVR